VPAIASWFCQSYASYIGLGEVSLSVSANERLSNYLWFGNLNEMETVIARTLALQRKSRIEAADLIFDFSVTGELQELPAFRVVRSEAQEKASSETAESLTQIRNGLHTEARTENNHTQRKI
jgi:transcriptional regulator with GAF, ATPase, and Fis domain